MALNDVRLGSAEVPNSHCHHDRDEDARIESHDEKHNEGAQNLHHEVDQRELDSE